MQRRDVFRLALALPLASVSGLISQQNNSLTRVSTQPTSTIFPPAPKFKLWDEIYSDWTVDDSSDLENDGKTFRDFDIVIGIIWRASYESEDYGWVYCVSQKEANSDYYECSEADIHLVSSLPAGSFVGRCGESVLIA